MRLREELDREREERNYFQLERDKVSSFWEISKEELEQVRAEVRNKDRQMEEAEERHQVEIKVRKSNMQPTNCMAVLYTQFYTSKSSTRLPRCKLAGMARIMRKFMTVCSQVASYTRL